MHLITNDLHNSLGLVANSNRRTQSGAAYNNNFEQAQNKATLIGKSDNDSDFTAQAIVSIIKKDHKQTAKIAQKIKQVAGNNIEEICKQAFNFTFNHIAYREDGLTTERPQAEELHSPNRIWQQKFGDCDDYAIFIGTILYNLNIAFALKRADYGKGFQHIYLVVPKDQNQIKNINKLNKTQYFTIDPVLDTFNEEAGPVVKSKHNLMGAKVYYLEGVGEGPQESKGGQGEGQPTNRQPLAQRISSIINGAAATGAPNWGLTLTLNKPLTMANYTLKNSDVVIIYSPNPSVRFTSLIKVNGNQITLRDYPKNFDFNKLRGAYAVPVGPIYDDFVINNNWLNISYTKINNTPFPDILGKAIQDEVYKLATNVAKVEALQKSTNPLPKNNIFFYKTLASYPVTFVQGTKQFVGDIGVAQNYIKAQRNNIYNAYFTAISKSRAGNVTYKNAFSKSVTKNLKSLTEQQFRIEAREAKTGNFIPEEKRTKYAFLNEAYARYMMGQFTEFEIMYYSTWGFFDQGIKMSAKGIQIMNTINTQLKSSFNTVKPLISQPTATTKSVIVIIKNYETAYNQVLNQINSGGLAENQKDEAGALMVLTNLIEIYNTSKLTDALVGRLTKHTQSKIRYIPFINVAVTVYREALKLLFRLNFIGVATTLSLAYVDWRKQGLTLNKWCEAFEAIDNTFAQFAKAGGNPSNLRDAIKAGQNKKPLIIDLGGNFSKSIKDYAKVVQSLLSSNGVSGLGVEPVTTTAAGASATTATFWSEIWDFIKKVWENGGEEQVVNLINTQLSNTGGIPVPITQLISGKGTMSITGGSWNPKQGAEIEVTAKADAGYKFAKFEVGFASPPNVFTENPLKFTANASNAKVKAYFTEIPPPDGGGGGNDGGGGDPPPPEAPEGGITAKQVAIGVGIFGGLLLAAKVFFGGNKSLKGAPKTKETSNTTKYKV